MDIVIENTNQKTKLKYNICCPLEPKWVNSDVGVCFYCLLLWWFLFSFLFCGLTSVFATRKKLLTSIGYRWSVYHISQNSAIVAWQHHCPGPEVAKVTGVPCLRWAYLQPLLTVLLALLLCLLNSRLECDSEEGNLSWLGTKTRKTSPVHISLMFRLDPRRCRARKEVGPWIGKAK